MDILKAVQLAKELMEIHGVNQLGYSFRYNKRRNFAGICSYRNKTIELSLPLTRLSNEEDVIDTILHEIAHALTEGHGHDHVWRRKAIEIGCNGKRCFGKEKESMYEAFNNIAKVVGTCPNGHQHFRNRMPKIGKRYSCNSCSNKFNVNFLITYKLK